MIAESRAPISIQHTEANARDDWFDRKALGQK